MDAEDTGLIVIGFDKGEGLAILFAASEDEARGGIFTSRGTSLLMVVCSVRGFVIDELEDLAGFGSAIDERVASRLVA